MDEIVIKNEPDGKSAPLAPATLPTPNISNIKNKQRRNEAFRKLKKENQKVDIYIYIYLY